MMKTDTKISVKYKKIYLIIGTWLSVKRRKWWNKQKREQVENEVQ